ncbi:TPA: methionyl-tRNA formyltransferase, partial [bacterium]|nr:methionyl-tRNA formyltransferase [bacterium]
LLLKAFSLFKEKRAELRTQNDAEATFAPKLKKSDGLINWKREAVEIHNLVRGLAPWPSAYTYLEDKCLKIWESEIKQEGGKPGEILEANKDQLLIACGKGSLLIKSLQREGKRRMAANEFLRGHPLKKNFEFRI